MKTNAINLNAIKVVTKSGNEVPINTELTLEEVVNCLNRAGIITAVGPEDESIDIWFNPNEVESIRCTSYTK